MELIQTQYIDALPYIDDQPESLEHVHKLISQEMGFFKPSNYLAKYSKLELNFESDLLRQEMKRVANKEPLRAIDTTRYELQPPAQNKQNDINAWKVAIQNCQTQLQHQYLRLENLELLQAYGANAWRKYNSDLEGLSKIFAKTQKKIQKKINDVNADRKEEQTAGGITIRSLESKWISLVHKNHEIENACLALEQEITALKSHKPDTNGAHEGTEQ